MPCLQAKGLLKCLCINCQLKNLLILKLSECWRLRQQHEILHPHMIEEPPLHHRKPPTTKKNPHTKAPNKPQCQPNLMGKRSGEQQVRC